MNPAWGSKYTLNINLEMNYWATDMMGLFECYEPFFELLERLYQNGKRTAEIMYGCRGFVAHHNTDIWADTAVVEEFSPASYWVLGAAWLCTHIFEHYQYTNDIDFLRSKYYLMLEAARFLLDFMIENKEGKLIVVPSCAPENQFYIDEEMKNTLGICAGCSCDSQIIWLLFTHCIEAAKVLGYKENIINEIKEALIKLPTIEVDEDNRILEWLERKEVKDIGHKHMSHLFALFPSNQITIEKNKELASAARDTLEYRLLNGGGHTGWSRAWLINLWARLRDSKNVNENVLRLLADSTYPSMLDKHPPFQIDGNFGGASGICESIVQSHDNVIHLLPALPKEWGRGILKGVCVRGGITLDIEFDNGSLVSFSLCTNETKEILLRVKGLLDDKNGQLKKNEKDNYSLKAKKGEKYYFSVLK